MKIGITCYPTYGGSGVVATELGIELAQRGHEVHFITYSQPFRLRDDQPNIFFHEVEVSRYPLFDYPPYDLALATRMAEVAEIYAKRHEFAADNEKLLVHLSNFRPVKRVWDVVEIFDRAQKELPAKLLLIGDGPDRSRAEWLAMDKGIHDKVVFLGKQDLVHEKLALADMMLLPSELESFGLAALEAMACEVVPVTTDVGGLPEVIDHGRNGFMARVGD